MLRYNTYHLHVINRSTLRINGVHVFFYYCWFHYIKKRTKSKVLQPQTRHWLLPHPNLRRLPRLRPYRASPRAHLWNNSKEALWKNNRPWSRKRWRNRRRWRSSSGPNRSWSNRPCWWGKPRPRGPKSPGSKTRWPPPQSLSASGARDPPQNPPSTFDLIRSRYLTQVGAILLSVTFLSNNFLVLYAM